MFCIHDMTVTMIKVHINQTIVLDISSTQLILLDSEQVCHCLNRAQITLLTINTCVTIVIYLVKMINKLS